MTDEELRRLEDEWLDELGLGLFDWQKDMLRELLGVAPDGKLVAYEVTIVVPRRRMTAP